MASARRKVSELKKSSSEAKESKGKPTYFLVEVNTICVDCDLNDIA